MPILDGALAPFIRREITEIMDEIRLAQLNVDELRELFELMTAVRRRVRARPVVGPVDDEGDRCTR